MGNRVYYFLSSRPAKEDDLENLGTILLLTVCDADSGTILGISAVDGMEIPHLYAHINSLVQGRMPERKKMSLSLFTQKETPVLKEIEARVEADDQETVKFYKANKILFEMCQIRRHTLTKWLH